MINKKLYREKVVKIIKLIEKKKLQIYFISIYIKFFYKTIETPIKNESIKNHSGKLVTVFFIF